MTAIHAVIGLEVPDDGLNGLAALEQPSFLLADAFGLAPMEDAYIRVIRIHTAVAHRSTKAVLGWMPVSWIRIVACSNWALRVWSP